MSVCMHLSVYLCFSMFVCLCACLLVCLSVFTDLRVCRSFRVPVGVCICLSICLFARLFVSLSICLSFTVVYRALTPRRTASPGNSINANYLSFSSSCSSTFLVLLLLHLFRQYLLLFQRLVFCFTSPSSSPSSSSTSSPFTSSPSHNSPLNTSSSSLPLPISIPHPFHFPSPITLSSSTSSSSSSSNSSPLFQFESASSTSVSPSILPIFSSCSINPTVIRLNFARCSPNFAPISLVSPIDCTPPFNHPPAAQYPFLFPSFTLIHPYSGSLHPPLSSPSLLSPLLSTPISSFFYPFPYHIYPFPPLPLSPPSSSFLFFPFIL